MKYYRLLWADQSCLDKCNNCGSPAQTIFLANTFKAICTQCKNSITETTDNYCDSMLKWNIKQRTENRERK